MTFNFDQVAPFLYQGSAPPCGVDLWQYGISGLVLAADEWQPTGGCFRGITVWRAGLHDARPTKRDVARAMRAARFVAQELVRGRPVLTTCAMGRNRSGLISALALVCLGVSADTAIRRVRAARDGALSNPHFVDVIEDAARVVPRWCQGARA